MASAAVLLSVQLSGARRAARTDEPRGSGRKCQPIEQRDAEIEPEWRGGGAPRRARLHYSRLTASAGAFASGPETQQSQRKTSFPALCVFKTKGRAAAVVASLISEPASCLPPVPEGPLRGGAAQDQGGDQLHLPDGRQEVCRQDPL